MLRFLAILFGIVFIFSGVAGFLPTFIDNNLLFGYFETSAMKNVTYVIIGVIAIMSATSLASTRYFFMVFGVLLAALAVLGFALHGDLMLVRTNLADNILHIVMAVVALYLGFFYKKS